MDKSYNRQSLQCSSPAEAKVPLCRASKRKNRLIETVFSGTC